MKKSAISFRLLRCGKTLSLNPDRSLQLAYQGVRPAAIFNDCSGKHLAMLAYCKFNGLATGSYLSMHHPLQKTILDTVAGICEFPPERVGIGIDGCSAPVFALPLRNMARGFLKLADPSLAAPEWRPHLQEVAASMAAHPLMISGKRGFCTALIKTTGGRIIGKVGAEGIYCLADRTHKISLALKIEDGQLNLLPVAVMQILRELRLLSRSETTLLGCFAEPQRRNDVGTVIGKLIPVFSITG